jgi:hypothetical protein
LVEVVIMLSGSTDIVLVCLATVVFVDQAVNATIAAMVMASRVRMDGLLLDAPEPIRDLTESLCSP